jgi:hypothetical protein
MERTTLNRWLILILVGLVPLIVAILWARRAATSGVEAQQTPNIIVGPGSDRWSQPQQDKRPAGVTTTPQFVNFVSQQTTLNGQPVPKGSIVRAFDPDGVQCGEYVVDHAGWYGLMPCYGDDPMTPGDEGARPGDIIRFTINDLPAAPLGPDEPKWTQNGALLQVNLAASSTSNEPTMTPTASPTATPTPQPVPTTTPSPTPQPSDTPTPAPSGQLSSPTAAAQARASDFLPLVLRRWATAEGRLRPTPTSPPLVALRASRWCDGKLPRVVPCVR